MEELEGLIVTLRGLMEGPDTGRVVRALSTIAAFTGATDEPLHIALLDDRTRARRSEKHRAEDEVLAALGDEIAAVARDPVTVDVASSGAAGRRGALENALDRLGARARATLLVTPRAEWVELGEEAGLAVLAVEPDGNIGWGELALVVARRWFPRNGELRDAALRVYLEIEEDIELVSTPALPEHGEEVSATAKVWVPLEDGRLGSLDGVLVALPAQIRLAGAERPSVRAAAPDPDAIEAAIHFVCQLQSRGEIAETRSDRPRATHVVELDRRGRRRLVRRRFR